jgi:hypothetical protein
VPPASGCLRGCGGAVRKKTDPVKDRLGKVLAFPRGNRCQNLRERRNVLEANQMQPTVSALNLSLTTASQFPEVLRREPLHTIDQNGKRDAGTVCRVTVHCGSSPKKDVGAGPTLKTL